MEVEDLEVDKATEAGLERSPEEISAQLEIS